MRFLIVVEKAKTGYSAYSPDLPGCVGFKELADLEDLADVLLGELGDGGAVVGADVDEALSRELPEGLAEGGAADVQLAGEGEFDDTLAGLELAVEDPAPEDLADLVPQDFLLDQHGLSKRC